MSWGNSASGDAAAVRLKASRFAAGVAETDSCFSQSEEVKAAHQAQAKAAEAAIDKIVEGYPEGTTFSFSVSASIGGDGKSSGYVNIGYSAYAPVAQPSEAEQVGG